jgi:hypothetical protein
METHLFLDRIPLWGILLIATLIVFGSFEGGYRFGKFTLSKFRGENSTPVGSIVAAILGLLAFMLAFTFGMAGTRFDQRRALVLDEANAIGTTYLRAEYLPEPSNTKIRGLLREYVDARLEAIEEGKLQHALQESDKLLDVLWEQAVIVAKLDEKSVMTGLFISSLNDTIDLNEKRVTAGLRNRIPTIIWLSLYFVTILGIASLGYQMGLAGSRSIPATFALILTFAFVLYLIGDLDRSQHGLLKVGQGAMIDLQKKLNDPKKMS